MYNSHGNILVVDDHRTTRLELSRELKQQGHTVVEAENVQQALEKLQAESFDLVLLDTLILEMDKHQVLERMKKDRALRNVLVIAITANNELESVARGIELGADDWLLKSFDPVLLKARIGACLEKKRLRDQEQAYLHEIQLEREKSNRILLNILPVPIAERLKHGERVADFFEQSSILCAEVGDFTQYSANTPPAEAATLLNQIFSIFDRLTEIYGLEKIKTINNMYMVVSGLATPRPDHLEALAEMALEMQNVGREFRQNGICDFKLRICINTGPVVAGIIGSTKFTCDLSGDIVNVASRMESYGLPGRIQVTKEVHQQLKDKYIFEETGSTSRMLKEYPLPPATSGVWLEK